MSNDAREPELGYLLGGSLIAAAIVSHIVFAVTFGIPPSPDSGLASISIGVYMQSIGLLFVAAYYFSHKTFLFRAIIWVCEHLLAPRGKRMAFFYAALFFLLGTVAMVRGFG